MACRVVVDALEDVGEVGLGVEALISAVSMRVMARARVSPPVSEPAKSQWLASDADGAHGIFDRVITASPAPVLKEQTQRRSAIASISKGFRQVVPAKVAGEVVSYCPWLRPSAR